MDLTQAELPILASLKTFEGYPVVPPEDRKNLHFFPRAKDDLPKEIKGRAHWRQVHKGAPKVYSFHREKKSYAVEYIANDWYQIFYSGDTAKYYTNIGLRIKNPEQFHLGTAQKPYLTEEDRHRLEKGKDKAIPEESSEQSEGKEELPEEIKQDVEEDIIIGQNIDDEDLATLVGAKMTTTESYVQGATLSLLPENPMILPEETTKRLQQPTNNPGGNPPVNNPKGGPPPGGNPGGNPGGSGGGGGGGGGGCGGGGRGGNPPPAQQAAQVPVTKHLVGNVQTFDEDRSKSLLFEKQFGLYRMTNANHPLLSVPMQRVCLALGFIQGDKVNRWSHQYANYLAGQVYGVNGQPAAYHPTDERLWIEFTEAFW